MWCDIFKSLRMWLSYCSSVPFEIWSLTTHNTRHLLTSAHLSVLEFMVMTLMKTLRICDCIFIQIYDRILCIIQSPCVIITNSSFIQFFQQPDEAQQIWHTVLYSTKTSITLFLFPLLYHNLPDNNPTLIPSNSQIFPISSFCHSTKCQKVHACISLKC